MKLNKKGFTLVELLAVIVVLAIIALIGYTVVGQTIADAQLGSAASTATNYATTAITQCTVYQATKGVTPTADQLKTQTDGAFSGNGSTVDATISAVGENCSSVTFTNIVVTTGGTAYTCTKDDSTHKWGCTK